MSRGTDKNQACRFGCGKKYSLEHYRNKHETHCKLNKYRGNKVTFEKNHRNKWILKGIKE